MMLILTKMKLNKLKKIKKISHNKYNLNLLTNLRNIKAQFIKLALIYRSNHKIHLN